MIQEEKQIKHYSTYGLILFFLLLPFEYPLSSFGSESVLKYVGIFCMLLSIYDIVHFQKGKIPIDARTVLMPLWCIYAGCSILWCQYDEAYSHFYPMYLRNGLMFLVISATAYSQKEVNLIQKSAVAGITVLFLYMYFIPGAVFYSSFQSRLCLAAGDSKLDENYLAALIMIGYTYVLSSLIKKKDIKIYRLFKFVFCAVCIYYIIATGSRSGLIAVVLVSFLLATQNMKYSIIYVIIGYFIINMSYLSLVNFLPESIVERFTLDAFSGQTSESGSRLLIWDSILNFIDFEHFFWGYGAGSGEPIVYHLYVKNGAVHSFFLGLILELGLIGFVSFITIIAFIEKKIIKHDFPSFALIVGCLIIGFFIDLLTTKFFWSIMMLGSISITNYNLAENRT